MVDRLLAMCTGPGFRLIAEKSRRDDPTAKVQRRLKPSPGGLRASIPGPVHRRTKTTSNPIILKDHGYQRNIKNMATYEPWSIHASMIRRFNRWNQAEPLKRPGHTQHESKLLVRPGWEWHIQSSVDVQHKLPQAHIH